MADTNVKNMDFFEKVGYIFTLIKPSWEAFKVNWITFVLLALLPMLLALLLIPLFILPTLNDSAVWSVTTLLLAIFGLLIVWVVLILIWPAVITTQFAGLKGEKLNVDAALNRSKDVIIKFVLASILSFFIVAGPLLITLPLLLVIVGLFLLPFAFVWALVAPFFLALVPFLVVNDKLGPVDAIKGSFELAKKHWQWVLAVFVVIFGLNLAVSLVSWIPLLGTLVSVAVSVAYFCMPAYVYINHVHPIQNEPSKTSASPKAIKKTSASPKPTKGSNSKKKSSKT